MRNALLKRGYARRLTAAACAVSLAVTMLPGAALAQAKVQEQAQAAAQPSPLIQTQTQAQAQPSSQTQTLAQAKAQQIDTHAGSYEEGGIIVVYRADAAESRQAQSGLAVQSQEVAGIKGASAQLLTEQAGIEGAGAAVHVDLPTGVSVGQAVVAAQRDPAVAYAQPIYKYQLLDTPMLNLAASGGAARAIILPDDPALQNTDNNATEANQWWISAVNAPAAWQIAHGDDNDVAVAVFDTGVNFEHPDLKANILTEYAYDACQDRLFSDSPLSEEMAHGSHVAGIIAAQANNGIGIAGVSYNAKVLPVRVFKLEYDPSYGYEKALCTDEDLIRGYDYLLSDADGNGKTVAEETGVHVVNMSLGGYIADDPDYEYDYAFEAKIEQAQDAGILTVAAGGNGDSYGNARTDASYPCDFESVVAVIALKDAETRARWSDYSNAKDIAAPGCNIYSTWYYGNSYHTSDGTSMASPIVAGCAALLWAYNPNLTVAEVKDVLYSTADDLGATGFDPYYGWGRVNAGAALESLGTASITAQRTTMMRTASQQLIAADIKDPAAAHTWRWSVDDPSKARISQTGMLTALACGKVEVSVESTDGTQPALLGRRIIEISEIAIPGGISASANPSENTIAVRWVPCEVATTYQVWRSEHSDGDFALIGTYEASELDFDGSLMFLDRSARPSVPFWYKVVPVAFLDGAEQLGEASLSARTYFTDKQELRAAIAAAQELLDTTKVSADGAGVSALDYWTTPSARAALNQALSAALTVFWNGVLEQPDVDAASERLVKAGGTFSAVRRLGTVKAAQAAFAASVVSSLVSYGYNPAAKRIIAPSKLYRIKGAVGVLSYEKVSGAAGITVARDGALIIKKALPAGTYALKVRVSAAGDDTYEAANATLSFSVVVKKAANPLTVKGKAVAVKQSNKARAIKRAKALTVRSVKGSLSFARVGKSKIVVNKKTGALKVPAGMKPGLYTVKIKVVASGNASYAKVAKTVSVKVRVKK